MTSPAGDPRAGPRLRAGPSPRAGLSLRARVGLLVGIAVGAAVALTATAAYVTARHQLTRHAEQVLIDRARAAAANLRADPQAIGSLPSAAFGVASDVRIAILDAQGHEFVAANSVAPPVGGAELEVAQIGAAGSLRTTVDAGVRYRVVAVPVVRGSALVLAQPTRETDLELGGLGVVMLVVGGVGVVLAASVGAAIARAGLAPVERLTAAAERVARTERLEPIPVVGGDELARLTVSFNAMLAALARSRARQQQLVADAGHELRTPLTSLRTNLDLLAQSQQQDGPRLTPADAAELLADVRAQVAELSALVGDLVELARDDPPPLMSAPVELLDVLARALDRVRRRAPAVRWQIDTRPWTVRGDATALERAVTNLLDNAAKWSPAGAVVTVTLADGLLSVADEGPGIAQADLPHVFERFYRSPEGRGQPGSGLGLAIVRQVAERHGGWVTAGRSAGDGALFRLWLPGSPADATIR
ncbi:MAG: HAMP domain-containing histidine kinase [Actinobacteria bacterium]|nr:HAMP domain-containing histidine kinase [Actinomycetota bacterium]MBI3687709.1 HAMP domain-containing histidine kinase [Actinomycetota bacterium]